MEISAEMIKIFNYLGEKFGIAIDWTSQNIIPYINDLCDRIIKLKIAENIIGLIIICVFFMGSIYCLIWILKDYLEFKKTNISTKFFISGYINEMSGLGMILIIVSGMTFILGIVGIPCIIYEIIKLNYVPEIYLLDYIKNLSITN